MGSIQGTYIFTDMLNAQMPIKCIRVILQFRLHLISNDNDFGIWYVSIYLSIYVYIVMVYDGMFFFLDLYRI